MESVILPRQMELILMMSTFTMVVEAVMARPQFLQVTQPSLAVVARGDTAAAVQATSAAADVLRTALYVITEIFLVIMIRPDMAAEVETVQKAV